MSELYVEKLEGDKYFFDGEWHPLKVVKETFKVRMGEDFTYEYKFTNNGPLLFKPKKDDIGFSVWFPLEFLNQNNDLDYSLWWVYDRGVPSRSFSIVKELFEDKPNMANIERLLELQTMYPMNVMFVTSDGDIGYHMTGLFPKRKYNVGQGVYPKKGWLKEN